MSHQHRHHQYHQQHVHQYSAILLLEKKINILYTYDEIFSGRQSTKWKQQQQQQRERELKVNASDYENVCVKWGPF